ncbi:MAG: autotransporter-associated beta strand repeat-containing protein, partial [Muribaculaceae bacterium]|nr:autotransporter-associated beta strand repeat-containing protein [Muribaculaceae bacterium]
PSFQGDILGDWREEYIMRDGDNNIRIYSTDIPTEHRIYSLWYDHQYRNAMNWQMCGYNQPPHVSFWLSSFEDITVPPAPLTMKGRTEVANNGTIDASLNGKHVIVCETNDMTLSAATGVMPAVLTINTPTWVEGHNNNNNITTKTYTHTISAGTFGGDMKLVKQGDGRLVMPSGKHDYTGKTEIWAGTFVFDGELTNSPVWLNRFGVIETSGLSLPKGLDMKYASVLKLGSDTEAGSLNAGDVKLGFGSIVELDVFADETMDRLNASKLTIEKKDWTNGPEYLQPIIRFAAHPAAGSATLPQGRYLIGEIGAIEGDLSDLIILGIEDMKKELAYENGKLYVDLSAYEAGTKTWAGVENGLWDLGESAAFTNADNGNADVFVPGDNVIFDDSAANTDVVISGRLQPASVTFNNSEKNYTLSGEGQIVGEAKLVKEGTGNLTINNINSYTGGTFINAGKLTAGVFANNIGNDLGALSDVNTRITIKNGAILAVNTTGTLGQRILMPSGHAAIEVNDGVTLTLTNGISASGLGQRFYKRGKGTLELAGNNTMNRLVIEEGRVNASEVNNVISLPGTVEFVKGALWDPESMYTYSSNPTNYYVAAGNSGSLYLDSRCTYTGKLTGAGTFSLYAAGVRCDLTGNWSDFEGELVANYYKRGAYDPDFKWDNNYGMPKATLNISSGVTFRAQSYNMALGNIKGSGTYSGTGTLTIGNDNKAINFSGKFEGNPRLVKTGKCDMIMNKLMSGINGLTVKDGTLSLNATKSPYNTTFLSAPLSIEGEGLLRGRGTVADLTVSGNGILEPGTYSTSNTHHYGPIFSTGNVTINNGATLSLYLRMAGKGNDCSYLDVKGTLRIDGNVKVTMNADYTPAAGDQFQLWKTGSFAGTPAIELPQLPEGLEWDFTGLKDASGILKVVEGNGVSMIGASEPVVCKVFDVTGICIGSIETTKAEAAEAARQTLRLGSGLYILVMEANGAVET